MPSQIPVNTDNKKTGRKTGDQFDHKGYTLRQVEHPNHVVVHPVTLTNSK
ncbi:hypothetical protein ACXY7N_15900 [Bacillus toyonensis]